MSRGREAARAAKRREDEARAEVECLREQLASERSKRAEEGAGLRTEIRRLKADQMAEASRLAAEEVTRRLAQLEEERRARGLSDDIVKTSFYLKDKFVLNACKYISMTTGERPFAALSMVMTWMTDEDFYGFENVEIIAKLGLPTDGWVARFLRHNKHDLKRVARARIKNGNPAAVSLDHALAEGNSRIDPNYDPLWYPQMQYPEIVVIDGTSDGKAAA